MHTSEHGPDLNHVTWRFWLPRLLISCLVTALAVATFGTANRLPFHASCQDGVCVLTPIPGDAAAAAVRTGDRAIVAAQPITTRMVLAAGNVPRSGIYALRVQRGAADVGIAFHTVRVRSTHLFTNLAVAAFILLFGLLMLWRGETAASAGLCLFALSIVVAGAGRAIPLAPPWNLVARGVLVLFGGPVAFLGLYLTADALAQPRRSVRRHRFAQIAYLVALALLYVSEISLSAAFIAGHPIHGLWIDAVIPFGLAAVVWATPLIVLVRGYRHGDAERRLRIRWFIASVALLLPLIVTNLLHGTTAGELNLLRATRVLLTLAIFTMLSYAVLSQRLVAVRFVVNRALVFGSLTALLIGALSLLESLIERSVISKDAGMVLDLAVPLLLGVSIQRIHRWGEDGVERLIFRKEYRDRNAILTFLRDAGFVAQPATLLERTAEVFAAHAGGRTAALYLATDSGYERVAASEHARGLPPRVPVDDVAMIRLRATLAPLDLFTVGSLLGASGLALPLAIRGRLEGVLVCGAKAEGRYAQSEVEFLEKAAAGIAACIVALRAELHGRFVTRVAEGAVAGDRVVEEARRLIAS